MGLFGWFFNIPDISDIEITLSKAIDIAMNTSRNNQLDNRGVYTRKN